MSELPKIYRSKIEKNFSNNKDYVYALNMICLLIVI